MKDKSEVNYRRSDSLQFCGNCTMYRLGGRCTLVKGKIKFLDVCNEWVSALWPTRKRS